VSWGGLNPALTSWRNGINQRFTARGTQSDGGFADAAHSSSSQHQPDADGTVDAFDCDVNFLGSSVVAGTTTERRIAEALKLDFEADPRAQLWIHQREIANRDVSSWLERPYGGESPHTAHIHFQSRQALERDGRAWAYRHTDALVRELSFMADANVVSFNAAARDVLKTEATEGSVGYNGRGLPSWPGAPEPPSFLNAFTQMFNMIAALQTTVGEIQDALDKHINPPDEPVT
jgi:hypothetical protein